MAILGQAGEFFGYYFIKRANISWNTTPLSEIFSLGFFLTL